jgi:hypothetical protein
MTPRSRRLLKIAALVYAGGLAAFIYAASHGRSLVARPELIPERLTIVQRDQFTGWRADERFDSTKRSVVAARYRMRGAQVGLDAGQLIDETALETLIKANPGTVLVWNTRLCTEFAEREAIAGEDLKDATGNTLAGIGDVLTEEQLVQMAMAFDPEKDDARHTMIWIRGVRKLYFLDVTSVFVCVNFLLLVALLYALLWEPVLRLLSERAQAIKGEVDAAKRQREEAESARNGDS